MHIRAYSLTVMLGHTRILPAFTNLLAQQTARTSQSKQIRQALQQVCLATVAPLLCKVLRHFVLNKTDVFDKSLVGQAVLKKGKLFGLCWYGK